jgi:glycosyltransferase involved in cell wall biosynthesis
MKRKRIFWLGMHQVLLQTELPRLRSLGYEVFNPQYNSAVIDQSAVVDFSGVMSSTLPADILKKLMDTNFFYNSINQEISEILNQYFGVVIVTINPLWLKHILIAYQGAVIYRVYGQTYSLSEALINNVGVDLIADRESFQFCPHSIHTLDDEDQWLLDRMRIVPYCITDDVVDRLGSWGMNSPISELGLLCPRIMDNEYYKNNYNHINHYFHGKHYKIFGKQIVPVQDSRVVGNVARDDLLNYFTQLKAFIYHYAEPFVCYLPPIEFMTIGGPVLYNKGSLLSKYYAHNSTPGQANDIESLVKLASKVHGGDAILAREIVESQKGVVELYSPSYVWPIFDQTFREMLSGEDLKANSAPHFIYNIRSKKPPSNSEAKHKGATLILFHKFGTHVFKSGKEYACKEGIARVTCMLSKAMLDNGEEVVVTAYRSDIGRVEGFFNCHLPKGAKVKILVVDCTYNKNILLSGSIMPIILSPLVILVPLVKAIKHFLFRVASTIGRGLWLDLLYCRSGFGHIRYIVRVNKDKNISRILVPHYHLFPEAMFLKKDILLYLPDYLPHFYPGNAEMGGKKIFAVVGRALAKKSKTVLTNSKFTQEYLPSTFLKVSKQKIVSFPLPFLNATDVEDKTVGSLQLPKTFVFYPTRPRASKRLKDFIKVVELANALLCKSGSGEIVYGVLTLSSAELLPILSGGDNKFILCFDKLSDQQLAYVYKKSLSLLFTSENEGNFPTQITEALMLEKPVIATRISVITAEMDKKYIDELALFEIGDCHGMATEILRLIKEREIGVEKKAKIYDYAKKYFSYKVFSNNVKKLFSSI